MNISKNKLLTMVLSFLILTSCKVKKETNASSVEPTLLSVINKVLKPNIPEDSINVGLRTQLMDTIASWQGRELERGKFLNNREWLSLGRYLALNENKNRALIFVVLKDTSVSKKQPGADAFQLISCIKNNQSWSYYFAHGNPTFSYPNRKFSTDSAEVRSWGQLFGDGLIHENLTLNNEYLENKWFPEDIERFHQNFLQDKY